MSAADIKKCPECNAWSYMPLHSAGILASHEIQPRQLVSASRKFEAVVKEKNEGATTRSPVSQLQQLRQQQAERQCQQQAIKPPRNNSKQPNEGNYMHTYNHLFEQVHSYENLLLAFKKARKRKTKKPCVQKFEANLQNEIYSLQWEISTGTYQPAPLTTFTVRDPKTRKISASHFRDRVVHHAVCNLIEPIFGKRLIYDTYANRKGKGTSGIIRRFDRFLHKNKGGYALKADIRHYFDTVSQEVLMEILGRKIKDARFLSLISLILKNHRAKTQGIGMPLGNLTSQTFANLYLGELDNFVKHKLRAKYYLRYVDDFIILGKDKKQLEAWKDQIDAFLSSELRIALHPDKTKIVRINAGVPLVGLRIFPKYKRLKKSNLRRFRHKFELMKEGLENGTISKEHAKHSIDGFNGYAGTANTHGMMQEVKSEMMEFGVLM